MLHIANIIRDQKFMDGQIAYHDLTIEKCVHDYYVVSWDKNVEFKYMSRVERVKLVTPDELIEALTIGKYDALFIHNFLYMPLHYMWRIPSSLKVFWFSWGYDIYNTPKERSYVEMQLLHPKSALMLLNLRKIQKLPFVTRLKRNVKQHLRNVFFYDKQNHNDDVEVYKKAVSRVDFFSGVFPEEYDLLKIHREFNAQKVIYNYVNPADWESVSNGVPLIGNNVLIGNSADINNNHLDILDYLRDIQWSDAKVIVPLSYGGSRQYADCIAKAYSDFLGKNCVALNDFMPREKYYELLSTIGVGIFFHERQQAAGNISSLLRRGVKVFLSETSINYKHYKSLGYYVYSLQRDFNQEALNVPLTKEQKEHNAKIWYQTSNKEYRLKNLYDIYEVLEKQK